MTIDAASAAYAEAFAPDDESLLAARDLSDELGVRPISPAAGAAIAALVKASGAKNVVEIGTGVGVSTLYLVRAMDQTGQLTSIDVETEHHRAARAVMQAAGIAQERTRLITGRALDVLPRLTDHAYDAIFVDGRKTEFPAYVEQALRLARPGAMVIVAHALADGKAADPAQRDPETTAIRDALRMLRLDDSLTRVLLPIGEGIAVAITAA